MGVLFVESIRRLYNDKKIDEDKIIELFQNGKITEEQKWYIFNVENVKLNNINVNLDVNKY